MCAMARLLRSLSSAAVVVMLGCSSAPGAPHVDADGDACLTCTPDDGGPIADAGADATPDTGAPLVDAGPDDGGEPLPTPSTPTEAWCAAYASYHCGFYAACCGGVAEAWGDLRFCPLALYEDCVATRPLDPTYTTLDASRISACLDAMSSRGGECGPSNESERIKTFERAYVQACGELITGAQGRDAPCTYDEECAAGLDCTETISSDGDESVCVPRAEAGGSCARGGSDRCLSPLACIGDVCRARSGPGEPCDQSPEVCEAGLYCNTGSHTCEPLLSAGTTCVGVPANTDPCVGYCDSGRSDRCVDGC